MSQYATSTEFKQLGLPADALEEMLDADVDTYLRDASGIIDTYIGGRYALPLVAPFPDALRRYCVCIATYHVLLRRGFNSEEYDSNYKSSHDHCLKMLQMISKGELNLPGVTDQTPQTNEGAPRVYSLPVRHW